MKIRRNAQAPGFSSLDLLVMLIAVGIVVMVGFAYLRSRTQAKAGRINCSMNLKQISLAFRMWGGDNGDKYPSQVSTNAGGTMELLAGGSVFPIFMVMSNELGTPKIINCPSDWKRPYATNFETLTDANLSYFAAPEVVEDNRNLWLSGDRNLATNTVALKSSLFTMPTNHVMGWTSQMHQDAGYIAMADGAVSQFSSRKLQQSATNALSAYYLATTNSTFRIAIP